MHPVNRFVVVIVVKLKFSIRITVQAVSTARKEKVGLDAGQKVEKVVFTSFWTATRLICNAKSSYLIGNQAKIKWNEILFLTRKVY